MVMHSAHNERKQETIVKVLLENWGTSKKITLSLHSLHGLHSLQFTVCMVCVSTWPGGYWSIAVTVYCCAGIWLSLVALYSSTGWISAQICRASCGWLESECVIDLDWMHWISAVWVPVLNLFKSSVNGWSSFCNIISVSSIILNAFHGWHRLKVSFL